MAWGVSTTPCLTNAAPSYHVALWEWGLKEGLALHRLRLERWYTFISASLYRYKGSELAHPVSPVT